MFGEITEQAVDSLNNENKEAAPSQEDSGIEVKAESQPEPKTEEQTAQDILDLAKLGKFKVDGQEMTYDELHKSLLRHQDYTKKTQALAEERKFIDNLDADLMAVRKDPSLMAQFKQIYPAKFHRYLSLIEQQQQAQGQPATQNVALPPEVVEKLKRIDEHDELINQFKTESQEATKESLGSLFDTLASDVEKKYPNADMVHVYGLIEDYLTQNNLTSRDLLKNRAATAKMFETYAKASHEELEKRFERWSEEKLKKVRTVNQKAGDIGKGGGTPMGAPSKVRMKDVADQMMAEIQNA